MPEDFKRAADAVLNHAVNVAGGAPGVVAMATDRKSNFYEGAAGRRELGCDQPMTTDTVMAIFSTTKALTGTLLMQLVEEYARNMRPDVADEQLRRIREAGVEQIHFAWAGPIDPGHAHYYRLHGPTLLIEFDNTPKC